MIKSGVGMGRNIADPKKAGYDAVFAAIDKLEGQEPNIVFLFASIKYDQQEVLKGARQASADAIIVGGSAAGEISSSATEFDAVVALAVVSDQMKFFAGSGSGVSKDSFAAGAEAAKNAIKLAGDEKLNLFIMIADGLNGNGAAIVRGAQSVLGENFPIMGGSAGDDYLFKKTYQYLNDLAVSDIVIGIGFTGDFSFGFGVRHGWEPVGLAQKVTKSEGAVLKELDGKPALKIYEDYFGKEAQELIREPIAKMAYTYPLGMSVEGSDELLIRDPVIANEKGEITCAAEIPEGTMVRLTIGDRGRAIKAAQEAAENALNPLEGRQPKFIMVFNCMARNKLLGVHCNEENQMVRSVIGGDVPMAGFYTYGEQGPLLGKKGTPCYFHNETLTILVIGE